MSDSRIIHEGLSYRIEGDAFGPTLVVTGPWTDEISRILSSGAVDGLDLNYAKGFKDTNLADVLQSWPLKRLSVLARTIKDLAPVDRLAGTLEFLSVQTGPAVLDLATFPLLTSLAAGWHQVRSSIADAPQLVDLRLLSYDEKDLTPLRWNGALTSVRFKDRPRISSLEGVEFLGSLERLEVYVAPLDSLDALAGIGHSLVELAVESCPIGSLAPLGAHTRLAFLNASECGHVASLHPLAGLTQLSVVWLYGSTRVVDDDLSPLGSLPLLQELRMRPRRSYRPSVEEIQSHLPR